MVLEPFPKKAFAIAQSQCKVRGREGWFTSALPNRVHGGQERG